MSEEIPLKPRRRQRAFWPVEATVTIPGSKPIQIRATEYVKQGNCFVFTAPDETKPYANRRVYVYEGPGVIVEMVVFVAVPQAMIRQQDMPASVQDYRSGQQEIPQQTLRFRSEPNKPPASEVIDESGHTIVVPAAFGMAIG